MTRYLVYPTQAEAQAAVDAIDARARVLFRAAGYAIDAQGAVIGKRDGADDPSGVTTTWDISRQRADGAWIVAHPEARAANDAEVRPGVTRADYVMQDLGSPVIEADPHDGTWFPSPAVLHP